MNAWQHLEKILDERAEKLQQFKDLYTYYKGLQINVTSIKDEDEFVIKNFYDSLLPFREGEIKGEKLIDIGTGGGFPGIPLAIIYPTMEYTLVDSLQKKIGVVEKAADIAGCTVTAEARRIEELGQSSEYREKFDIVTSRALAPWTTLLEYALPLLKVSGTFVAYQGPAIKESLTNTEAMTMLGGELIEAKEYNLPLSMGKRIAVLVKKVSPTPEKYPRNAKKMKKQPL